MLHNTDISFYQVCSLWGEYSVRVYCAKFGLLGTCPRSAISTPNANQFHNFLLVIQSVSHEHSRSSYLLVCFDISPPQAPQYAALLTSTWQEVMRDPVIVPESGWSYERKNIEARLRESMCVRPRMPLLPPLIGSLVSLFRCQKKHFCCAHAAADPAGTRARYWHQSACAPTHSLHSHPHTPAQAPTRSRTRATPGARAGAGPP
jgi:hypothetical protein